MSESTIKETGDAFPSFNNVFNLTMTFGAIVGVIHVIMPYDTIKEGVKGVKEMHATQIFFAKGYVYTAHGLALGYEEGMAEDRFAKVLAMQTILSTIWGLAPHLYTPEFYQLGIDEITKNLFDQKKNTYFLFRTPEESRAGNLLTCEGYESLMNSVEQLRNDDETVIMIGAQDE